MVMQQVEPRVYLIACPDITEDLQQFLKDNNIEWTSPIGTMQTLHELAGRLCYESWENSDNKNITKIRRSDYLKNIVKQAHGSVFEHGNIVFLFNNVSRIFTHELVRHRVGSAFSQTSGRYVRLNHIKFWIPDVIANNPEAVKIFRNHIFDCEVAQARLEEIYDIDNLPMAEKKKLTSAFRRIAPCGLANNILWSTNIRALRHVIQMRTSPAAEVEIQKVFRQVYYKIREWYPEAFYDAIDDEGIQFECGKI